MKKFLMISCIGAALIASSAAAQNITTLSLSATIDDVINLGPATISGSAGVVTGGSGSVFSGSFPTSNNTITGHDLSIIWANASITKGHTLRLSSANGGLLHSLSGTPGMSGFTQIITYQASLFWADYSDVSEVANLNFNDSPSVLSDEGESPPMTSTGLSTALQLNVLTHNATNLAVGTYSDTLTATITPLP